MPPSKKRKVGVSTETNPAQQTPNTAFEQPEALVSSTESSTEPAQEQTMPKPPPTANEAPDTSLPVPSPPSLPSRTASPPPNAEPPPPTTADRQARFRALQARAKTSTQQNLKATAAETHRLATDPALLTSLSRKHAIASHNLLKADTEDFERKRAWDWTIDESEKWDKRMAKKEKHREDVAFQDYRQDARKIYKRQLRELKPDVEHYAQEKALAVQKAAQSGGLEIVETEDGELVAVDRDGTFYSTADSTGFVDNKPEKAAVDRLVKDIQKAEETRLRKRRERGMDAEEGDVTYINDKNKQFNQKLARFYNKYTAEIRDSFERGTMI